MGPQRNHTSFLALAFVALQSCRSGYEVLEVVDPDAGSGGSTDSLAGAGGSSGGEPSSGGTGGRSTSTGGASASGGAGEAGSGGGGTGSGDGGTGGVTNGGSGGTATGGNAGTAAGGNAGTAAGGNAGTAAGGAGGCTPTNGAVEACDGLDNDCDGVVDEDDPCEPGCFASTFSGHGYMFCANAVPWADAQAFCAANSMSLVRIDSAEENAWLLSTAQTDAAISIAFVLFIGASDSVEDEWTWIDGEQFWSGGASGSPVGDLYSNWARNEPNDQGASGEDCAGLRNDGTWSDVRCDGSNSEMPFACETQ